MDSKKIILIIAVAILFLTSVNVQAVIVGLGRFDKLIKGANIIVKGTVTRVDTSAFEMYCFSVDVITVLKSDDKEIPSHLDLEVPFPVWPEDLGIPFTEKQVVLLVLKRGGDKISVVNSHRAILPAIDNKTLYDVNSPAQRIVFEELRNYLPETKNEEQKGLVLVLLSQLGSRKDEKIFLPYTKSENEWLRRSAIASLVRLNPTPERIKEVVDDFADYDFILKTEKDILFWEMYQDIQWASRCGAFGLEKDITARAKVYLPVYRVLIDKAPSDYQRVYIAIDALKDIGTREDILRLYKYIDDEKPWIRHDVLEGISRILGLQIEKKPNITSYMMPLPAGVDEWEKKSRSDVEQALKSESII